MSRLESDTCTRILEEVIEVAIECRSLRDNHSIIRIRRNTSEIQDFVLIWTQPIIRIPDSEIEIAPIDLEGISFRLYGLFVYHLMTENIDARTHEKGK